MSLKSRTSQLYHLINYSITKPAKLEKGMVIFSIDVDVGYEQVGIINQGKNDANTHNYMTERDIGKLEEASFPLFVNAFEHSEAPATFALRGQMLEIAGVPEHLLNSSVRHEIGGHGYYHKAFPNLSKPAAKEELEMLCNSMKKCSLKPSSFIFPRNLVGHLDLLSEFGYKCFRSKGGFKLDCMLIEKIGALYDVHPSIYLDRYSSLLFLKKTADIAASKKAPLHIWFHMWNFGYDIQSIEKYVNFVFSPFLEYVKKQVARGVLSFETMDSAVAKLN
jgi:peptidoglycan/xylan/chitin deacetylase (PgdA/CDA1 family)